jgi:hypothetical protein
MLFSMVDAPGQTHAEQALDNLAGQGILGSTCVLLIIALFYSIRLLLKAKDDRHADQKAMAEALSKLNDAARQLTVEMNKSASNLVVEAARSQDSMRNALSNQEKSLEELTSAIRDLGKEQTSLQIALVKGGTR